MARKRKKKPGSSRKKRSRKKSKSGKQDESAPEKGVPSASAVEESPPEAVEEPPDVEEPPREVVPDAAEVEIIDLDGDAEEADELARLIADTVATAQDDEPIEAPAPLVDLDAELDASEDQVAAEDEPPPPEGVLDAPTEEAASTSSVEAARDAEEREVEEAAAEALRRLAELGPVSSPEVRSRLLAEALAHAEHKDARYRVPYSQDRAVARWKALGASVLLLLAAVVAAAPPQWARPDPPARLTVQDRARNLRAALLLQAQEVEAFRVREQRLPAALDEVRRTLPGLRYVRSGTRAYQLIAYQADGSAIVYDSVNPTAAFDSVDVTWAAPELGS